MKDDEVPSDFTHFNDMANNIGLPVFGARVLVFVTDGGRTDVAWAWEGDDVRALTAIGALESMKLELFHNHAHQHKDDE